MSNPKRPLDNLSVMDFGLGLPGALVTRMLADAGARIRRFEPSAGDPFYELHPCYSVWRRDAQISRAETLIAATTRESGVLGVQLRHMSGAIGRSPRHAGSRGRIEGQLLMFAAGVVPDPAFVPILSDALARVKDAVSSHRIGASYASFVEEPADARSFYDAATWSRLRSVKGLYDPSDLFRGNHHIPPAC